MSEVCQGPGCDARLKQNPPGVGRPRLFCGDRCKRRAHRARDRERLRRYRAAHPGTAYTAESKPHGTPTDLREAVERLVAMAADVWALHV